MKRAILLMVLLAAAGCGSSSTSASDLPPTSVGVYTQTDLVVGTGATAGVGSIVVVSYTGWLYDTGKPNGKGTQFDSGTLPAFVVGSGNLIQGFQQGVVGMKAGGQRRLIIPPALAYGSNPPSGTIIPVNATLVFEITLISVS
jgi:FKBP-type peptidyl-prolyl cis-trans isomerase FkpA